MDSSLTPFEQFLEYHDYDYEAIFQMLLKCTHCYYDHEVFVCGYKTHSDCVLKNKKKKLDKPDTWYVMFAAGNLLSVFDKFEKLPYLCFFRSTKYNKLKLISYKRLRDLYGQKKSKRHSS